MAASIKYGIEQPSGCTISVIVARSLSTIEATFSISACHFTEGTASRRCSAIWTNKDIPSLLGSSNPCDCRLSVLRP
jgi:hypothetical protein